MVTADSVIALSFAAGRVLATRGCLPHIGSQSEFLIRLVQQQTVQIAPFIVQFFLLALHSPGSVAKTAKNGPLQCMNPDLGPALSPVAASCHNTY